MEPSVYDELKHILKRLKGVELGTETDGHDVLIESVAKLETIVRIYAPDETLPRNESWFRKFLP